MPGEPRRFPPPWSVDEPDVKSGRTATSSVTPTATRSPMSISRTSLDGDRRTHLMKRDEVQRIAAVFPKLPELLKHAPR
jgi:hypothetical protein